MAETLLHQKLWFGTGPMAAAVRLSLRPVETLYRAAVWARAALYDRALLPVVDAGLLTVSVGNLAVGGTGKTPVVAWIASNLAARGVAPAVVLRGYGADEGDVHRLLNPEVGVFEAADRVSGIRAARAQGADVAVLDDAFQHRRAMRRWDVVLVSADHWTSTVRLLPTGPFREPMTAIRRATLVVVTRKAASEDVAATAAQYLRTVAPHLPLALVYLAPAGLRSLATTGTLPIEKLSGRRAHALLAIANPDSFVSQLRAAGAEVTARVFRDHHWFSDAEIHAFASEAVRADFALCTLKDAVKVAGRWPREAPPLWYVSQHVIVERGADAIDHMFEDIVHARGGVAPPAPNTAG